MNIKKQRLLEQMGQRLEKAADRIGIPVHGRYTRIAKEFKDRDMALSPMSVKRWFDGSTFPSKPHLQVLCDILGVRHEWLSFGQGRMHEVESVDDAGEPMKALVKRVPLLDYRSLFLWLAGEELGDRFISVLGPVSSSSFVIRLTDSSLSPCLSRNLPVIVDPEAKIHPDDYIMARQMEVIVYGRAVPQMEGMLVDPINPGYKVCLVRKDEIIGKITATAQLPISANVF